MSADVHAAEMWPRYIELWTAVDRYLLGTVYVATVVDVG